MVQISKRELMTIRTRFPKAEIHATRHNRYLAGSEKSEAMRLLSVLRGITPPPSRRQRKSKA